MFFSELTGADQESNREEAKRNVARSSFGMAAIRLVRLACASARPGDSFCKKRPCYPLFFCLYDRPNDAVALDEVERVVY